MSPRLKFLAAGFALILLANAVALTGVFLNRSGEAESRLALTQRELGHPWGWRVSKENSGLALNLQWRVADASTADNYAPYFGNYGGSPAWLDEARMVEFGFDVADARDASQRRRFERQTEREVLVVLELGGAAWELMLERARRNLAQHAAARQVNPEAKEFVEREKRAREQLEREERQASRLFAVDAGLKLDALRAKYPDRARYMILKGKLRPRLDSRDGKTRVGGYLASLQGTQLNVPYAMRPTLEAALKSPSDQRRLSAGVVPPLTATVAVGSRLEPWIESLAGAAPSR